MRKHSFSMIELATVMAVILLLVAVALPRLKLAELQAKVAEVPLNTDGIIVAEMAYDVVQDAWLDCAGNTPDGVVGRQKRDWVGGRTACYDQLGWRPDGAVYATYYTQVFPAGTSLAGGCLCGSATQETVTALAFADVDGDGQMLWWLRCNPTSAKKEGRCSQATWY